MCSSRTWLTLAVSSTLRARCTVESTPVRDAGEALMQSRQRVLHRHADRAAQGGARKDVGLRGRVFVERVGRQCRVLPAGNEHRSASADRATGEAEAHERRAPPVAAALAHGSGCFNLAKGKSQVQRRPSAEEAARVYLDSAAGGDRVREADAVAGERDGRAVVPALLTHALAPEADAVLIVLHALGQRGRGQVVGR